MATRSVHDQAERLRAQGVPFVHARVVLAERPTSAKPGDEAIILLDGTIEGFVGGQCAEATVRSQGIAALQSGCSVLLRISPIVEANQQGKLTVHNPCLSGGTLEIFMEPVLPAPRVAVVGDSPIARALVSVGTALGYELITWSLLDMRTTDALVVATHGLDEERALVDAVKAQIPYVALVASPKRGRAVLAGLDLSDDERSRVKSPAGLDIGARTPEEIAVSVFAEIIDRRSGSVTSPMNAPPPLSLDAPPSTQTAVDPICQMTVAMVDASIHAEINGGTYWFCCPGCRDTFIADPAQYLKA